MAMGAGSKLIISHVIGKRSPLQTDRLLRDMHSRINGRYQFTSDGYEPYRTSMPHFMRKDVDFAQLVKQYANPQDGEKGERRYSVTRCIGARKVVRIGHPDLDLISTSYIERTNLSVRLFNRRFTRLTLGYSKKFEYLCHSAALFVFVYNFIKVHKTHGKTPAMAAGLAFEPMTFERLLLTPD